MNTEADQVDPYQAELLRLLTGYTPLELQVGQSVVIVLREESQDFLFVVGPYSARAAAHRIQTRHSRSGRAFVAYRHRGGTTYYVGRDQVLGTVLVSAMAGAK